MKKLSKDDLKLKGQVVTGLNETVDSSLKMQDNGNERGETDGAAVQCNPDTFNSECLCFTQGELGCIQSKNCPYTESGGEICCVETFEHNDNCVVDTNMNCNNPTNSVLILCPETVECGESEDVCYETDECPETVTCANTFGTC